MLLSGGEPPAQEWLRVQNKSKPRVQRQRLPLQRIFRVKLSAFQGRPDTSYFWLRLEGPKENLSKAKEYLKGLCSPELWKEVRYPPVLHCVFLGAQGLFLDCLCWSSQAYLVPGAPGSLMVGGLTDSFVLTQNWLEELVGRLRWGSVPLFTPRGAREVEVSRAFGALVWLRADQYAGCLLQLPPAVQELLLSLVRDTAGKEDIIEWLGSVGPSPRPFLLPKQSLALVPAGDSAGPTVQAGAPRKGASENSKRLSSPGNTRPPPSSTPGQSPPQEAAKQLVWVSSRNQGDSEDSAGKEGASQGNGSSQDSANHTQAWSPQRQVQRVEDKLPFPPPPVSILGLCPPWKAWTPAPVAFGPLWPGAVAATFWRINELQSLHLAWLLSQAYLTFPFWQRPLGPIQLKLPGQTPLPLNLEWKPKELVPLPSVERLDGGPGGEAALQNCPSPETPHKVVSLLVVSGGPEAKDQASPGLLQIEPPLPSTPQAPAGSELGALGSGRRDCEGLEGGPIPALSTGPEVSPTAERPGAQGALPAPEVLEAQVMPETLKAPVVLAAQTVPGTLKAPAVLEAQTVPETFKAPAVLEAQTVPETLKAPAVLEAQTVPETLKAPAVLEAQTVPETFKAPAVLEAQTVPGTLKAPAVLEAQTVPETLKVPGAAAMPTTPALSSVPALPAAAQVPAAPMMLPVAPAELADPRAPLAPAKPVVAQGVSAAHKAAGGPLATTAAAAVPATAQTLPTQKGPVAEAAPTGRRGPKPPTGPVAQTGAVTPKGPAAPKASRAPQTPVAQKGSPGVRSTSDAAKLLSNAPPSPKGSASCPQGPPLSVRPHMEGLLDAWEGTPRQSPRHLQPSSTVTSFQRFHEALNTPFELALSEEPGDQGLRRVVIDGSSVAMVHGLQHFFSCRGIAMAVQYFWNRGHREVTVFVPTWQLKKNRQVRESHFLTKLHSLKMLSITPSQLENGKKVTTYDYRFMVKLAEETDGVLVTNEQLHVLMNNSKKHMVKDRLLPFTFAGNLFMVPDDPLGRDGPTLDEFLKKPNRLDTDVGNFLKVWKTLPPRPARLTELSEEDTLEPQENPQELVEEIREEERREEHQEEGLEVQEPGGQEPGVQGEGLEVQEPGEKEPGVQELAEEDDNEGSLLASVFRLECPVLSEELLRCLSLPEAPHGVLDIDLLPGLPSPSLGVPWDGKPPCQQVLAHLARLTIPSNFTALSFFLGFMDSHRDVIPDYEALVGPLHSLLRLKPDWRWEREHELAFLALKRGLVSALCLSAPDVQLPFRLEVLVSRVALTAVVYQEHSGRRHPVAYTSKPLLPDEQGQGPQSGGDSPYAVAWALKHFSRCIGDSPVILDLSYAARPSGGAGGLEACQSPDNAWLIRWKLLVQDKGKRTLELTLLQGLLGENRRLMPAAALPRCFQALPPLSDLSTFVCIHMSGYCFSQDDDEWCSGFGLYVLSPSSPPVSLSFSCAPSTPTYAHLAAVACGLERFGQSQHPVVFLTHCSWIFSILWELLPLWQARGFLSSDGAPLPHPDLLSYIIALTSGLSTLPFIYRTSYRGSLFAVTVDTLAKRGAQGEGPRWDLPKDVPSPVVSPRAAGKRPDLLALQLRDSTLADTIAKLQSGQRPPGSSPFGSVYSSLSLDRESGLLMFKGEKRPRVWVVPRQLRRDLIFSVHDLPVGAHQKPEETYKKVRLLGWWPGMQEYVRTYCRSCLFCTPQSPGGGELKVIESLWPLRSTAPWANLQIEVVGPVTASEEGHKHVLIVADPNTRWVEAFPLKPYSHAAVAQLLLQHVFARWGVPVRLEAAQGTQFARHVLVSCGLALGAQVASASRDLQLPSLSSSGAYWEFKRALREFILLYGRHWASCLPLLHLAFRASSLQDTPVQILMGAEGRLSGPLWWEMSGANIQGLHMDNFLRQLTPELLELHWRAADKASEKAENRRFLRESREREWKVGDQVLLLSLPRNGSAAKWVGPFYIGDRLSLSLYRVWGFPTPEKLGCIYPSSLMKAFANCATLLPLKVLEQ